MCLSEHRIEFQRFIRGVRGLRRSFPRIPCTVDTQRAVSVRQPSVGHGILGIGLCGGLEKGKRLFHIPRTSPIEVIAALQSQIMRLGFTVSVLPDRACSLAVSFTSTAAAIARASSLCRPRMSPSSRS